MRVTLSDVEQSRIPQVLGLCREDTARLASYVNEVQERLIQAGGETGWWNGWAKVAFDVVRTDPYITLPSQFARIAGMDVCQFPVRIQNEWYEFMDAGVGLQKNFLNDCGWPGLTDSYDRSNVPTAYDLPTTNQYLRVYLTDVRDVGTKFFVNGAIDQNGNAIYTTNVSTEVQGALMVLDYPFVTTSYIVTAFSSVTKVGLNTSGTTYGDIIFKAVDATSGVETFLSRYTPQESTPQYRRYFIKALPCNCCPAATPGIVQVTCMCKYEYRPVVSPSDVLIIGNIPALKMECESIRYGEMDSGEGLAMSQIKHKEAIKLLNAELRHYLGALNPAINWAPFGNSRLEYQGIGQLT